MNILWMSPVNLRTLRIFYQELSHGETSNLKGGFETCTVTCLRERL